MAGFGGDWTLISLISVASKDPGKFLTGAALVEYLRERRRVHHIQNTSRFAIRD